MEEFNEELEEKIEIEPDPDSDTDTEPDKETEPAPDKDTDPDPEPETDPENKEDSSDVSEDTSDENFQGDNTEESEDTNKTVEDEYIKEISEQDMKVIERINALLDALETENEVDTLSVISIPISGYRDWNYGINVKYKVYPYGAGYYMDAQQYCSEPEDFEAWYSRTSLLVNDTLRDFYIVSVTDDDGKEVYNYETYVDPGDSSGNDVSIPIDGYRDWNYSINVRYKVYPYGAGYYMEVSDTFADSEEFEEWYSRTSSLINDTLKDFYILTVTDDNGTEVYNYESYVDPGDSSGEDEPENEHNPSGQYLEILQDIYAELEAVKESEEENQLLADEYRKEMLNLQTAETGSSIIICVALFIIAAEIAFREIFARLK